MTVTQFINSALTATTYLSTELDSLAIDGEVLGAAINNSTNRDQMCKVQIYLASTDLSLQANPYVQVRLVESIDGGVTYEDDDDTCYGISLPLEIGAATQVHVRIGDLMIPPGYFELKVVNKTGVALVTGNTLKYATYTPETDI